MWKLSGPFIFLVYNILSFLDRVGEGKQVGFIVKLSGKQDGTEVAYNMV